MSLEIVQEERTRRAAARHELVSPRIVTILGRGALSGLLLYLAFPPADRTVLAWVALVPLLTLLQSPLPRRTLYLAAWLGGLTFWVPSLAWIWELHPGAWLAWIALAVYQSIYWPIFFGLARGLTLRARLPIVLGVPLAWVSCEYVQAHALSGFPWYYLAHSQYRLVPLIQISDITGAWGVSFVIAMVNAWLALFASRSWRRPALADPSRSRDLVIQTAGTAIVVAATLAYGFLRIGHARFEEGPRVLLLQSNFRQALKNSLDPEKIMAIYRDLIQQGFHQSAGDGRAIDLTIWPETSYPFGFTRIDPALSPAELTRSGQEIIPGSTAENWLDRHDLARTELLQWSQAIGGPMLVGSTLFDLDRQGGRRANAAVWVDAARDGFPLYFKIHLVPFGEYIPLIRYLPWISRLAPYDERHLPRLARGARPAWFEDDGLTYAPVICFEDTVPHVVRRFFSERSPDAEPDVLVNISNDGWFNGSAEHDLHLAIGVFRAVENRAPLVRSSNMGYTAWVDGNGEIRGMLPKRTQGSLLADVLLDDRRGIYSRIGDIFAQIACFASAFAVCCSLIYPHLPARTQKLQSPESA